MFVSRILSRASRSVCRTSSLLSASQSEKMKSPILSNQFHSLVHESATKFVSNQASLLYHSTLNLSSSQRFRMASTASPESSEKEPSKGESAHDDTIKNGDDKVSEQTKVSDQTKESGSISETQNTISQPKRRRRVTKKTSFSDSDSENDENLSMDDLAKLVAEKEELLKIKHKEIEKMQDKVLRSYAEMENVMDRTRREAENAKKFAMQSFAKSLLDVADNLGRASSVVKESFLKIDTSKDPSGAAALLKTLLDGVEMTEKQLLEVFKKFGVEKFDPTNEPFDPHRHHAVFQIPDGSKPPGTVAAVTKAGYMLYDRVLRPAEVGVTQAVENETS